MIQGLRVSLRSTLAPGYLLIAPSVRGYLLIAPSVRGYLLIAPSVRGYLLIAPSGRGYLLTGAGAGDCRFSAATLSSILRF
jgi:hypothetical protein